MANENPRHYGFDAARYAQVNDELRRAEAYFMRLRDELRDTAASTAKQGYTVRRCRDSGGGDPGAAL